MVHLFLADGFEEIEALGTLDILRRAGIEVLTVSITGARLIRGAHNIPIMADNLFRRCGVEDSEMLVFPGGMPGMTNLGLHDGLRKAMVSHVQSGRPVAAICAAPALLGRSRLLAGRRATCYPGFEPQLDGAVCTGKMVEVDGNIITGRGPGAVFPFAFSIVERLRGAEVVEKIKHDMLLD